jgi:uracil-DNA glycosylase
MVEHVRDQPISRRPRRNGRAVEQVEEEASDISSLAEAREAIDECRRCPLYEYATQAVFGEGPGQANLMFVGEQPGDQEDLAGKPFVGPAGKVFDAAIEHVGIDRGRVYVTNAVKHFKFVPRGKKRLHQRPDAGEIAACRFWLNLEREFVKPKIIVALGATAAQSLLGKGVTISKLRGAPVTLDDGTVLFVTNHPSYLLRIPDREAKRAEQKKFEADLVLVRDHLRKSAA